MIDTISHPEQRRWLRYALEVTVVDGREVWSEGFELCADQVLYDPEMDKGGEDGEGPMFQTWLDYELEMIGWPYLLGVHRLHGCAESELDWLLREGIAPGQPFQVRFYGYRAWGPDHNGEYDSDYEFEIIKLGPPPSDYIRAIEQAWGLLDGAADDTEQD